MRRQDRATSKLTSKLTLNKEQLRNIAPSQLANAHGGSAYPAHEYDVTPPRDGLD